MQLHDLILRKACRRASQPAVTCGESTLTYEELAQGVRSMATGLTGLGVAPGDRVAIWLEKRTEAVLACFGASLAGAIFVPVSPLAKSRQIDHILRDSGARVLITTASRFNNAVAVDFCRTSISTIVLVGNSGVHAPLESAITAVPWDALTESASAGSMPPRVESDAAAIFYTSGSTGQPKGVVVSHRNLVAGAFSVAGYLRHSGEDAILAALPLSFDAGFSQLTTTFVAGAHCALHEYLLPGDAAAAIGRHDVTGLTGVPAFWNQLSRVDWPESTASRLRYIANTGGVLPQRTIARLREKLPKTQVYLMYGLTEAFRSTYLPPEEVERRPTSIGRAIPNAEVLVVRPDGSQCEPGEPGELVHRGPLVSLGYWNDPEATALRFRPAPNLPAELPLPDRAVWSGDTVISDSEGFLYFVGRADDMIKCSGYRISPTEVEEVVHDVDSVTDCAAFGAPHPELGQAVVLACTVATQGHSVHEHVLTACAAALPSYMIPRQLIVVEELPRTPNGKIDRCRLAQDHRQIFDPEEVV